MSNLSQSEIFESIIQFVGQNNIITTPRIFLKILGDLNQAIFLNQLLYWQDKMKGEWLFKTYQDWDDEIGLSEYHIRKATNRFIEIGFLEAKIKQANKFPTVHYRIDKEKFMNWFLKNLRNDSLKFKKPIINITNKDILSKDNIKGISEKSRTSEKDRLVEVWNSLKQNMPIITLHKNPSAKVYRLAVKYFKHLKNGTFGNMCHVSPEFKERNHITNKVLNKKWTDKEIKENIKSLSLLFKHGYWPLDKKTLAKDLPSLIYNPRTNTSMFLLVYMHPPKPIKDGKADKHIENEIDYKKAKNKPMTEDELRHMLSDSDKQFSNGAKRRIG